MNRNGICRDSSSVTQPTILVLEPYWGGSHRTFLEGLAAHLPFNFEFMTMPARKWKWRMRLAAIDFAKALQNCTPPDLILCSTFVDVATLRGLGPLWMKKVPIYTYFHENQFVYPVQENSERDLHFALTNYTTALASDGLAFNSTYNRDSFLSGAEKLLKVADDMALSLDEESLRGKSVIISPGLDFSLFPQKRNAGDLNNPGAPVIVWNHRWEHDKNPELFFRTLFRLDQENVPFRLIVLGQEFQGLAVFKEAEKRLSHRLCHFGFCSSREEYVAWLQKGDIVVSTAHHEFFGLAVIEAVKGGCRPLLPARLSYPELFPEIYLYKEDDFYPALLDSLGKGRLQEDESRKLTDKFAWENVAGLFTEWFRKGFSFKQKNQGFP